MLPECLLIGSFLEAVAVEASQAEESAHIPSDCRCSWITALQWREALIVAKDFWNPCLLSLADLKSVKRRGFQDCIVLSQAGEFWSLFSRTLCASPLIVVSFPNLVSASWPLTPLGSLVNSGYPVQSLPSLGLYDFGRLKIFTILQIWFSLTTDCPVHTLTSLDLCDCQHYASGSHRPLGP